jgi:opacity protein-like surface antigen
MRKVCLLAALILIPILVAAQDAPHVELFGGYSYLRNSSNNFNGWEGQASFDFNRFLGVTADFDGHYRTVAKFSPIAGFTGSANQRLYTFLFGPTATARFGKHDVYAHALFGGAHSSLGAGVSLPIIGTISTGLTGATAFGMALGGGVDFGLTDHIAIRPAQVDYVYTRFNTLDAISTGLFNGSGGHQNSFRYSGGLVFRF